MAITRINTTKPPYISYPATACVYKIRNKITNKYYIGSSVNYKAKLKERDILEIREEFKNLKISKTKSYEFLSKKYFVSTLTISRIILRKSWTHI